MWRRQRVGPPPCPAALRWAGRQIPVPFRDTALALVPFGLAARALPFGWLPGKSVIWPMATAGLPSDCTACSARQTRPAATASLQAASWSGRGKEAHPAGPAAPYHLATRCTPPCVPPQLPDTAPFGAARRFVHRGALVAGLSAWHAGGACAQRHPPPRGSLSGCPAVCAAAPCSRPGPTMHRLVRFRSTTGCRIRSHCCCCLNSVQYSTSPVGGWSHLKGALRGAALKHRVRMGSLLRCHTGADMPRRRCVCCSCAALGTSRVLAASCASGMPGKGCRMAHSCGIQIGSMIRVAPGFMWVAWRVGTHRAQPGGGMRRWSRRRDGPAFLPLTEALACCASVIGRQHDPTQVACHLLCRLPASSRRGRGAYGS